MSDSHDNHPNHSAAGNEVSLGDGSNKTEDTQEHGKYKESNECKEPRRRWVSSRFMLSWINLIGVVLGGVVFAGAASPLRDNSFFTHLATGRFIIETGSIPRKDIYTYTAEGTPWVVQSWLVSWLYATLESIFGVAAIRLTAGFVAVAIFALLWVWSSKLHAIPRTIVMSCVALTLLLFFSPRPALFGALFTVVAVGAAFKKIPAWVLLPVGALWVNAHGSWPTGLLFVGVVAAGALLDRSGNRKAALSSGVFLTLGVLVGSLWPLGAPVLVFPLNMLDRQDVLSYIIEWQRPEIFSITTAVLFLLVMLAFVGWARNRTWTSGLLIVAATLFGMSAHRNIPIASLILFFPVVEGLRGVGRELLMRKSFAATAAAGLFVVTFFVAGISAPNWDFEGYPVEATVFLQEQNWISNPSVVVAADLGTGNFWSLKFGTAHKILYDDRFDMYDKELIRLFVAMDEKDNTLQERKAPLEVFNPDVVVWNEDRYLPEALEGDEQWRLIKIFNDGWMVFCNESSVSVNCEDFQKAPFPEREN